MSPSLAFSACKAAIIASICGSSGRFCVTFDIAHGYTMQRDSARKTKRFSLYIQGPRERAARPNPAWPVNPVHNIASCATSDGRPLGHCRAKGSAAFQDFNRAKPDRPPIQKLEPISPCAAKGEDRTARSLLAEDILGQRSKDSNALRMSVTRQAT